MPLILVLIFLFSVFGMARDERSNPRNVCLLVPDNAAASVEFGAAAVREALGKKRTDVRDAKASCADLEIVVTVAGFGKDRNQVHSKAPQKPESYSISLSSDK